MILAWLSAAFVAGVLLGASVHISVVLATGAGIALAAAAILARRTPWQRPLLLLACLCLGSARNAPAWDMGVFLLSISALLHGEITGYAMNGTFGSNLQSGDSCGGSTRLRIPNPSVR